MSKANGEKLILTMGKKRGHEGYEDKATKSREKGRMNTEVGYFKRKIWQPFGVNDLSFSMALGLFKPTIPS